ncbi:hypothetical protein SHIRM173S_06541 [Streptomyces hirsutus]
MWLGGSIFPSGHTANAVVTWESWPSGLHSENEALAVRRVRGDLARRRAVTVYLGTHWLSDVLLGWVAGLLILLALPWFEPLIARAEDRIFGWRDRWYARRGRAAPAAPVATPVMLKPLTGREAGAAPEHGLRARPAGRTPAYLRRDTDAAERAPLRPAAAARRRRTPRGNTPPAPVPPGPAAARYAPAPVPSWTPGPRRASALPGPRHPWPSFTSAARLHGDDRPRWRPAVAQLAPRARRRPGPRAGPRRPGCRRVPRRCRNGCDGHAMPCPADGEGRTGNTCPGSPGGHTSVTGTGRLWRGRT